MWKTIPLGEVADVKAGNSAPQDESFFHKGSVPFVRTSDVGAVRKGRLATARDFLNSTKVEKFRVFPKGTVLFPKSGASTLLNHRVILSTEACVSSHLAGIKACTSEVLDSYLFYFLQTIDAADLLADSSYPSLQIKVIQQIPILVPPLAEQKRIVERLDKAFAEIDKAQNANAKSERQLMVVLENAVAKLLITPKSTSELTELSEFLDETITGPFGSSLHKSDYTDNGVAVINPQNILNGEISTSNCNFISYEKAKDLSRYSLQVGDIVLGRRGEMGRCAVVDASEKKMICGTGCMILRAKSGCSPYYLAELIRSKYIRSVLEKNSIGMTMANLNQKILLNVKIPRDSYRNQIERVNTCRRLREFVDSAITIRKNKANKLTDIRRSILKQELTPSEAV